MPAHPRSHPDALDGDTYDAFAGGRIEDVPETSERRGRVRTRRGGPRTPLPLLPLIAVAAGIGVAYVAQSAHLTQATYQATTLAAEQSALRQENSRLGDELARLRSSSRIDAAAQHLGMRPPARWAYVYAQPAPVTVPPAPMTADLPASGGDPVQRLVAALSGSFGPSEAEAAGP